MGQLSDKRMASIALSEPSLLNELIDSTFFEELEVEHQNILVKAADYYDEYGEYPHWDNLGEYEDLFNYDVSDADKQEFRRELNEAEEMNLKVRLYDAVQTDKIKTHQDVIDLLDKIQTPRDERPDEVKCFNTIDKIKELYRKRKERFENAVSTGLSGLNYLLGSDGWLPKNIYAFQGPNGVGKSIWLINVALQAALDGKKVFYITLEMSDEDQFERFIRAITKSKSYDEVMLKEAKLEKYIEYFNNIYWLDRPPNELSSETVKDFVDNHLPWKPDIVIIDYIDEMATNNIKEKFNAIYEKLEIVSTELFALAKTRDIPIITATQSNRSAINPDGTGTKDYANMTQTADSFNMLQKFSGVFGIIKDELKEPGKIGLQNIKSRHGQNYIRADFLFDSSTLRISDTGPLQKSTNQKEESVASKRKNKEYDEDGWKEKAKKQGMRTL